MKTLSSLLSTEKFLFLILILAFILRIFGINNPVLDWHAFRQADTASVTRYFAQHDNSILIPKYDDLSNIASGLDNPEGYRMVEFPVVNWLVAQLVKLSNPSDISQEVVFFSRLMAVFASVISTAFVYFLVKKISGRSVALFSALFFAILPFNIYYNRVVLPEPYLIFGMLGSLLFWHKVLESHRLQTKIFNLFFSILFLSFALLMKPFAIFIYPVFIAIAFIQEKWNFWKNWSLWLLLSLSLLPLMWWRWWIAQFPSGIPANNWLFNSNDIRFKPSWFRWLFFERLIRLQLGYFGLLAFTASIFNLSFKEKLIYGSWWLGMLAYLSIIATGNVQHDYYQAMLTPIISITLAKGWHTWFVSFNNRILKRMIFLSFLAISATAIFGWSMIDGRIQQSAFYPEKLASELTFAVIMMIVWLGTIWLLKSKQLSTIAKLILIGIPALMGVFISAQYIKEYYQINHWEYLTVGKMAQTILPQNAKVIAPAQGDTMFLYQLNRPGWALGFEIEKKIELGATHYVSTNRDEETNALIDKYQTLYEDEQFIIIDLLSTRSSNIKNN